MHQSSELRIAELVIIDNKFRKPQGVIAAYDFRIV